VVCSLPESLFPEALDAHDLVQIFNFTVLPSALHALISPRSLTEDAKRVEYILNVLLIAVIFLLCVASVVDIFNIFFGDPKAVAQNSLTLGFLLAVLIWFSFLYFLSRTGLYRLASYCLISTLFLVAAYMGYRWGVDVNASLLFFVLLIVMSGILISTRFAFIVTGLIFIFIIALTIATNNGLVLVDQYWRNLPWTYTDSIVTGIIFFVIATVSWLSNREIERSLTRARRSEQELKEERDLLEVRVAERTEALRQAQLEKMEQSYRFVEFGRIASGIFHDLANPLTALSLNLDSIAQSQSKTDGADLQRLSTDVGRAKQAATHMEELLHSMRVHLSREGTEEMFSLGTVIDNVVSVVLTYARQNDVRILVEVPHDVQVYGDSVVLTQVLTNLLSNAIDSYPAGDAEPGAAPRVVTVSLRLTAADVVIAVSDHGVGIEPERLETIFEPFVTTKSPDRGLGIGLPLAQRMVEKRFGGTLTATSELGVGSTFTMRFPKRTS
jgi:signal transduction histidine kinase